MIYYYYCKELGHTKYHCTFLKGKLARGAYISVTLSIDEQLRHQFEQFQMFQQQHNTQAHSSFFSATLAQAYTLISCLTSSMSHTWIIHLCDLSHDRIMSFFTPAFNSVVLVDGSHIPIQGIDIATITPTLHLSIVFYLPCFSFNLLSVRLSRF